MLLAACGGGGGGGGSSPAPPGGTGTNPTAPPSTGAQGDVRAVASIGSSPAIAYDDDDRMILAALARTVTATGGGFSASLPGSDTDLFVRGVAYSHAARAVYFASATTIYRAAIGGAVTTVAGGFHQIEALCVDSSGTVYAVDDDHVSTVANGIAKVLSPPGTVTNTSGTVFSYEAPQIAFDSHDGALYVTDPLTTTVKRVTTAGAVTTVAGSCALSFGGGVQSCFPGMRAGTGSAAEFGGPAGIAYDASADMLYISDAYDHVVWSMTPGGTTALVAGYGAYGLAPGNGRFAFFRAPLSLAMSSADHLVYIDDFDVIFGGSVVDSYVTAGTAPPASTFPLLEFATTAGGQPQALAKAPDDTVWITEGVGGKIAHVTPAGIVEYPLPPNTAAPFKITVDASGAAWSTVFATTGPQIGIGAAVLRTAADGTQTPFAFSGSQSNGPPEIDGITTGSDGNPWFGYMVVPAGTTQSSVSVKTIDRATSTITDHPFSNAKIRAIAAGPDGTIWLFTFPGSVNLLTRMATTGQIVGQPFAVSRAPIAMAPNPIDHSEWYVDGAIMLGRVDLTGAETDTMLCTACLAQPEPSALAIAPDGSVWFAEDNPSNVAHRDLAGNVTRYILPSAGFGPSPNGIAVRADGKVWVGTAFGSVVLLDPVAYDAIGLPHQSANAGVKRAPRSLNRATFFGKSATMRNL
jgi:streptogramin lyase